MNHMKLNNSLLGYINCALILKWILYNPWSEPMLFGPIMKGIWEYQGSRSNTKDEDERPKIKEQGSVIKGSLINKTKSLKSCGVSS